MKLSEEVKGEGVVRAVDLFLFEGQFYIVRDYYKKGTLEDEIERLRKEKNSLPLPVSLSFFFFFSHSFPFLSFLFSSLLLSLPFVDLRCSSTML
jgi:serine/threonine protein kinase